ncbi:MAG: M15 family metallopeptidase [Bacteroidota bacterium]
MRLRWQNSTIVALGACLLWSCGQSPSSANSQAAAPLSLEVIDSIKEDKREVVTVPPPVYDYDTSLWTDIHLIDASIILDLKYATTDNFVKEKMYECGRCLLRPPVAKAIFLAHQKLQKQGLGLKMLDCYRPRPIQQKLWDKVPNASYVTPPAKGSMHNRGSAVDLTIVRSNGEELDMGTPFDFFGPRAHHTYTKLPDSIQANRQLLRSTMKEVGLRPIRTEWWHYYYPNSPYELSDMLWDCDEHQASGT